eukprot:TRINITY_DN14470_c0_g1_i1.p1 TRINITY_DN14470_c0_g1~~TRINITY_DN14470_c0_g1_i1.p1  ORF type:complete len:328 (-),score=38.75 TRINITY_DN14470_c0_g1_i1:907-1890(-)
MTSKATTGSEPSITPTETHHHHHDGPCDHDHGHQHSGHTHDHDHDHSGFDHDHDHDRDHQHDHSHAHQHGPGCNHDHDHGHGHDHDHGHSHDQQPHVHGPGCQHGHGHGHGHEHGQGHVHGPSCGHTREDLLRQTMQYQLQAMDNPAQAVRNAMEGNQAALVGLSNAIGVCDTTDIVEVALGAGLVDVIVQRMHAIQSPLSQEASHLGMLFANLCRFPAAAGGDKYRDLVVTLGAVEFVDQLMEAIAPVRARLPADFVERAVKVKEIMIHKGAWRRKCDGPSCENREAVMGEYKACAACKMVFYCGVPCQKASWQAGHKAACKTLRA